MKLPLTSSKTLLGATLLFTFQLQSEVVVDSSFQAALTGGGTVYSIQVDSNGDIYIAGEFSELNGTSAGNIARLKSNGSVDGAFSCAADGLVRFVRLNAAGEAILGGQFGSLNGESVPNIGRVLIGGGVDDTFAPQLNFSAHGCAFTSEWDLILGGNFTTVNGAASVYVARLDGFGNATQGFTPVISTSMSIENGVQAVAVGADGRIYVGGNFTTARGFETVARLNADGTLDGGFCVAQGTMLYPTVIVPLANGQVVVAGVGNSFGQAAIKRLNADGSVDGGFHAPSFTGFVNALVIQPDGKILAGGWLGQNGTSAGLLRLKQDGTVDTRFSIAMDGPVHAIAIQADQKVIVGGGFSRIGGVDQAGVARLEEKSFGFHSSGTQVDGAFTTTLQAQSGRTYVIESSIDLQNWSTFATNTATNAGLEIFDGSKGLCRKFFRAKLAE